MKQLFTFIATLLIINAEAFTKSDTLLGSNGAGRNWWNVLHYDIQVDIDLNNQEQVRAFILNNLVLLILHLNSKASRTLCFIE